MNQEIEKYFYADQIKSILKKLTFGIEIETLGDVDSFYDSHEDMDFMGWGAHADTSVSDDEDESGCEAVSPRMTASMWNNKHKSYLKNSILPDIYTTPTAGLHVHVGIRNMSIPEYLKIALLQNLVLFFARHEEYFVDTLAKRWHARRSYCRKISFRGFADELLSYIGNALESDEVDRIYFISDQVEDRYKTLNLRSLGKHGTVEFRFWNSTDNITSVQNAITHSVGLVAYAMVLSSLPPHLREEGMDIETYREFVPVVERALNGTLEEENYVWAVV